jgi:hypothetical protein
MSLGVIAEDSEERSLVMKEEPSFIPITSASSVSDGIPAIMDRWDPIGGRSSLHSMCG